MKTLTLFFFALSLSLPAAASFRGGYKSPQDLLISLSEKFGGMKVSGCESVIDAYRAALGDQNLQTGEPFADEPGAAFVSYWNSCLNSYAYNFYDVTAKTPEELALRNKVLREIFAPVTHSIADDALSSYLQITPFPTSVAEREALVRHWVRWALGSDEEILAYGRMSDVDQYRRDLTAHLSRGTGSLRSLLEVGREAISILLKRDEFLMYQ